MKIRLLSASINLTALFWGVLTSSPAGAQTLDTISFGNSTSETSHALATDFPAVTPASVVTAGGGTSPTDPPTTAPTGIVTGALGLSARQLLPRSPNPDVYGGEMSFTMAVDPVKQNYFTTKFWGSDTSAQWFVLDCNGKEVGWRHGGNDQEILWSIGAGWFPNRFIYRTAALPLNLTQGQTSVTIKIRSLGWISYYDSGAYFNHYQKLMNGPSPNLYTAYTHTGAFFDSSGETQGAAPVVPTPETTPTQATEMSNWQSQLNSQVSYLLASDPSVFTADNVDFLAQSYGVSTSIAYQSTAALNKEIAVIDTMVTAYSAAPTTYMSSFGNPSWGGYFGPVGDAIRLLWPQLSTGNIMSTSVSYGGVLGTVTRTQAWSAALRASVDYGRYNRRTISNQEISCCTNIYEANRGLELVAPANALAEPEALRYPYEASGASPWLGNDQPTGGTDGVGGGSIPTRGTQPYGPNWYMTTTKGTTKENDFVGSDYGEQGANIYNLGTLANDASLKAQGLKMLRARANFRNPGVDSNGYLVMYGTEPVGIRNDQEINGHVCYLGRTGGELQVASLGSSVIGTDLMGYLQQQINDGQFYAQLAAQTANFAGAPYVPSYVTAITGQSKTGIKMPESSGQPDFAWGDEENMVIAAKHGSGATEERFYANTNWRAAGIDGIAKVFRMTGTTANLAEVMCDDVQFNPSGQIVVESSSIETFSNDTPPDNPISAYSGVHWQTALRSDLTTVPPTNQDAGRAWGYTLRYGNWLVGIDGHSSQTYTMKLPAGFTSAIDLVSGKTLTAPIILSPKTSVVFYLSTTTDSNPTPSAPTYVSASGSASQITLTWNPAANATSYIIQRATSSAGPYTIIATGITGTTYTDSTANAGGTISYYQVIAVNSAGQSNPSPTTTAQAGLPAPWANTDVGTVGVTGSSFYQNNVFTVSGSGGDIGSSSDSFQYAYVPMTGNGTITARVTNISGTTSISKVGVMMRETLATGSRHASLLMENGGSSLVVVTRSGTNGSTGLQGTTSAVPLWIRMTRAGNVFTAYQSSDGINWVAVGNPVTITMNTAIDVGLACCARSGTGLVYTNFDHVSAPGWTAPAAPAGLTVTPGDSQATLAWTAVTGATSYTIQRATVSGGPYTTVGSSTTPSYTDGGLTDGTTYYYVISAVNLAGQSANSTEVSAQPSNQPTNLTATAGNAQVALTWTAPLGSPLSYNVYRTTTSGSGYAQIATGQATTSYTDATAVNGTTYYYVVTGVYSYGEGADSAEMSARPMPPFPAVPTSLAAVSGTGQISLSWSAVPYADGYNVKRSQTSGGPYTTVGTSGSASYTDTGLAAGLAYYYVVTAVNISGESGVSSEAGATTLPGMATGVSALPGEMQAVLNWTIAPGAVTYDIERGTASGGPYTIIATNVTSASFTDSGLTDGTTYYYVIAGVDAGGISAISAEINARPMPPIAAAPAGLAASGKAKEVDLTWTAAAYAASYNVKRSTTAGGPYSTIATPTTTSYSDIGLADGTTYYYVVSSVNLSGEGANSAEVNALTLPGTVTGLAATAGSTQVTLTWSAVNGPATYTIGRSTTSGGPYAPIASSVTTTTYTDTSLTNGTTYYYVVGAANVTGVGANSTEISARPMPPIAAVPAGVVATGKVREIDLVWSASSDAASYNVKRSATSGGPYTTIAAGVTSTNYADAGLTDGASYFYVISAVNISGESANSVQVGASTVPGLTTGLVATAGSAQVSLTWTAVTGATGYTIGRSTTAGGPYTTAASGVTTAGYTDTSLTNGTTYYYVVAAVDSAGTGTNSSEVNAKPMPPLPSVPTGLAGTGKSQEIDLTWASSASAATYNVKRSSASGGPYITVASGVAATGYNDTGLSDGTTYYYVVSAVNITGESANSTQASAITTIPLPVAVTGLAALANSDQVALNWTAVTNATSYTVSRATVSGGPYTAVASGITVTTYTDTGLTNGITYYYVVAAVNVTGTGPNSTEVNATPTAQNLYWDTTVAAGLANGNGNWDSGVTATWSNSSAGTSNPLLPWLSDDNAFFQTAGTFTATLAAGTTIKVNSISQSIANTAATISGGTLQIDGNAGITNAVGSGNKALTVNSAVTLNSPSVIIDNETTAGSVVLNGVIAETGGSRALIKTGAGVLQLGTAANTFSGGVTLNSVSQVAFSNSASFGTGTITFNGGTGTSSLAQIYTASTSSAGTLANNLLITAGSFGAYAGDHTMILNGSLINTGGSNGTFVISSGTHAASVTLAGDDHAFNGAIVYNDNGATALLLGSVNSGSTAAIWTLIGGSTKGIAANVSGASSFSLGEITSATGIGRIYNNQATGTATFIIGDSTANSPSFGGTVINGSPGGKVGITKSGTDTQILTGANTYTGPTSVASGTLLINGSLAAGSTVTVASGATLGGSGTISGATNLSNGGILSPGGSGVAKLTFAGALNLNAGGILNFDLGTVAASDTMALTSSYVAPASGKVTINLNGISGFAPGTYPIITGATSISASSFTLGTTPAGYNYQLTATSGTLNVTVSTGPVAPTGLTALASNSEIGLSWTASPGATSYSVLRSTTSGGPYTTVVTGLTATSYVDTGLTNGTIYYYVATATNTSGTSINSNQANATPVATAIVDSWFDNDIGAVSQAGSSTYSAGTFTLNGSGAGITGIADGFDYTYQPLVGDGTIIARVATQSAGESGVMIRETLTAGSRVVDLQLQQNIGAVFQYRLATGGSAATGATVSAIATPYWLKLARAGNVFTGFISTDGVTWTQVGQITNTMASSVYVGLMQSSVTNTSLSTGTFTNASIVPTLAWASQDIGTITNVGASYYSNAVATIHGSGADIWGTADQFRYTYLAASGDCDITARVTAVSNTSTWAKAGVMIRETTAAGSRYAGVYVTPGNGVSYQSRSTTNGSAITTNTTASLVAPYWVRMVRSGNTFTAYRSPDGTTWTTIGSQTITMATAVYIGLPVCSHNSGSTCTATFDHITADP